MLNSLHLTNFAVMEEVEVNFGPGLTVLTGETGAGKSIVMDALGLLVGSRAEADVIRTGADEAVIEGIFERTEVLGARLDALGLPDLGAEVSVRRTVGRTGKGRVHINGALASVGVLQRLMNGLIDIAGQHEHLALFDSAQHLSLVDRFGEIETVAAKYADAWSQLTASRGRLAELGGDAAHARSRADFVAYQLDEIEKVAPEPDEDVSLEAERRRLASSEKLRHAASAAEELLSTRDASASELVTRSIALVGDAEKNDSSLEKVRTLLMSGQSELEEATRALSRYLSSLESDPKRLTEVEDRLDALRRLCRKHVAPLPGVLQKRDALRIELESLQNLDERRADAEREVAQKALAALEAASALTVARQKAAEKLEAAVRSGLDRLALGKAVFSVQIDECQLSASGADSVTLMFSANAGETPKPLGKVASGGEASRLMLAMKAALARSDTCACYVFDEADAGVGGAVADVVGRLIKTVSLHRQVLCITHLPQVAAHGDAHVAITKSESRGRTRSVVTVLDGAVARARELARMLSGVQVTEEAVHAAEALLRSASQSENSFGRRKRNQRIVENRRGV